MLRRLSACSSERSRQLPLIGASGVGLLVVRVPGGKLDLVLVESVDAQHFEREVDAADDFVFDLLGRAEDVGVVLGEAAHAQQAVHDAGALVAIDGAELAVARGQIAVGLERVLVDEDVERTVHGLHAVFRVVQFHGGEHVLRVVAGVAGGLPEVGAGDVRREDERVAAAEILVAHPVFHLLADEAALGMPEDEAGAGELLNGEQVELLAEQAMVALLGFFELVEVVVEVFLGVERGAVDALELRVLLVAQPVGAGDVEQLEGLDASGGRDVRAAAEVGELAGLVDRDLLVGLGELLDEVALHEVAFGLEALEAFGARQKFARVGQVVLWRAPASSSRWRRGRRA